nr:MGMT family protein [Micromonospora cremea]
MSRGFRRTVRHHLATDIGGRIASYGSLAGLTGNPKALRAVGTACATNPIPIPIIVPFHRVARSDGTIGSYRSGPVAKHALLDVESAV